MTWGTPLKSNARKVLLLGSGELGKELIIELQRLGIETVAVDSYGMAPGHQVAHRHHVIDMLDGEAVRYVIERERPDFIVPELEAIHTPTLEELETQGFKIVPNARATTLTMNREGIRKLAAEQLKLPTSGYSFADSYEEFLAAVKKTGLPCYVKPTRSSCGRGQSYVQREGDLAHAWDYAIKGSRARQSRVMIESPVLFDYEITLLTVSAVNGIFFCEPIGQGQVNGDYRESWQPHPMPAKALAKAQKVARTVVEALGGYGLFGVELFIKGEDVWFSEVSPRPHATGMVTLCTQNMSQFALHVMAFLGLPVSDIRVTRPGASAVLLADKGGTSVSYSGMEQALLVPETQLRLFGKPNARVNRRMGIVLANANDSVTALKRARESASKISLTIIGEPPSTTMGR